MNDIERLQHRLERLIGIVRCEHCDAVCGIIIGVQALKDANMHIYHEDCEYLSRVVININRK